MTTTDDDTPLRTYGPGGGPSPAATDGGPHENTATLLDELRESLVDSLPGGAFIDIPVPGRPRWAVRFRRDLEFPQFSRWLKRAKDKSQAADTDALRLATTVIANQCSAILRVRDGAELRDGRYADDDVQVLSGDEGNPLVFSSPELQVTLDASSAIDAARKFYVLDGYAIQVSADVLDANGLGDEVVGDPS
jgi:hypothetical protein